MATMYPPQANSPATTLASGITDIETTITVTAGSVLPTHPNLLTIGADTATPETVLMTNKSGNTLTVTRAQDGTTAKAWDAGVKIQRVFTAADHQALIDSINACVLFVITFGGTAESPTCNKTFAEILAAYTAGQPLLGANDVWYYHLHTYEANGSPDYFQFSRVNTISDSFCDIYTVFANDEVAYDVSSATLNEVTYVGAGTLTTAGAVALPSGIAAGDLLILVSGLYFAAPTGWTRLDNDYDPNMFFGVWYKLAAASETPPLIAEDAQTVVMGRIFAYRGVNEDDPCDIVQESAVIGSVDIPLPQAATFSPNCYVMGVVSVSVTVNNNSFTTWDYRGAETVTEIQDWSILDAAGAEDYIGLSVAHLKKDYAGYTKLLLATTSEVGNALKGISTIVIRPA